MEICLHYTTHLEIGGMTKETDRVGSFGLYCILSPLLHRLGIDHTCGIQNTHGIQDIGGVVFLSGLLV
jgi:hypothetical protein